MRPSMESASFCLEHEEWEGRKEAKWNSGRGSCVRGRAGAALWCCSPYLGGNRRARRTVAFAGIMAGGQQL